MKKFKLFLVGLGLICCSSFAFAMEKIPKEKTNENLNLNLTESEYIKNENTILIKGNEVKDFDLTKEEKNNIKNFVLDEFDVSENTIENLLKSIKINLKWFLENQLSFKRDEFNLASTNLEVFDKENKAVGTIILNFKAKNDKEFNLKNKDEKKAECFIKIKSIKNIITAEETFKQIKLNKKFIKREEDYVKKNEFIKKNTIIINKDEVENFELPEKNKIEKFIFNTYSATENEKQNLLESIKINLKWFLKKQLNFKENGNDKTLTYIDIFDENNKNIGAITMIFEVKKDEEFNLKNKDKKAECFIKIHRTVPVKGALNDHEITTICLNTKFIVKKQ